jgi:hypothetical protein
MGIWKSLIERVLSRERRLRNRQPAPRLTAFFWNGTAPMKHEIRDISMTGLYLVTEERWYPGTLVMITLQKKSDVETSQDDILLVQSKTVRWGHDGVGLEFVLPEGKRGRGQKLLDGGADRKALEKFLKSFKTANGSAVIRNIVPPDDSSSQLKESKP